MQKRGQATIFIIIGLILITGAFFLFQIISLSQTESRGDSVPEATSTKSFITACLDSSFATALDNVAKNGGRATTTKSFVDQTFGIPYWFFLGSEVKPTIEFIEKEIAKETASILEGCLDDFSSFRSQGFTIVPIYEVIDPSNPLFNDSFESMPQISVEVHDSISKATYTPRLSFRKDGESKVTELSHFSTQKAVGFGKLYDLSNEVLTFLVEDEDVVCMTCLAFLANENDVSIEYERYGGDYFFSLHDPFTELRLHWSAGYGDPTGIILPVELYFEEDLFDTLPSDLQNHFFNVLGGER